MTKANPLELAMLDMVNNERVEAGLEELRLLTILNSAAENHSNWMLDSDMFSHAGIDDSSPSDRMEIAGYDFQGNSLSAENIGWQSARGPEGYEDDVAQVHEGLMASPGHRANILNPDAEDIGIGIEIGTFSGDGDDYDAVMVTQVFGSTDADLSAWVDPGTVDAGGEMIVEDDDDDDEGVFEDEAEDATDDNGQDEVDDEDEQEDEEVIAEADSENADDDSSDDAFADDPTDVDDSDPTMSPLLPCDLADFRIDLREAFEFRQEGDQLIWETSEERLTEVFMKAFEDWSAGNVETVEDAPTPGDIEDLMMDEESSPEMSWANSDEEPSEDWLFDTCA